MQEDSESSQDDSSSEEEDLYAPGEVFRHSQAEAVLTRVDSQASLHLPSVQSRRRLASHQTTMIKAPLITVLTKWMSTRASQKPSRLRKSSPRASSPQLEHQLRSSTFFRCRLIFWLRCVVRLRDDSLDTGELELRSSISDAGLLAFARRDAHRVVSHVKSLPLDSTLARWPLNLGRCSPAYRSAHAQIQRAR